MNNLKKVQVISLSVINTHVNRIVKYVYIAIVFVMFYILDVEMIVLNIHKDQRMRRRCLSDYWYHSGLSSTILFPGFLSLDNYHFRFFLLILLH